MRKEELARSEKSIGRRTTFNLHLTFRLISFPKLLSRTTDQFEVTLTLLLAIQMVTYSEENERRGIEKMVEAKENRGIEN